MEDAPTLKNWMRDVQRSQNAVDSILLLQTTPSSYSRCGQLSFCVFDSFKVEAFASWGVHYHG